MRTSIPPILLGTLIGWFASQLRLWPAIAPGDLLSALVTVAVGWWIQQGLGRQSELNRVPIDNVARLFEEIESLTTKCMDRQAGSSGIDPDLVSSLQRLSNEISWLESISRALSVDGDEVGRLRESYFRFKTHLSGDAIVDLRSAAEVARQIRALSLVLQTKLCRRVLEEPEAIDQLARSTDSSILTNG